MKDRYNTIGFMGAGNMGEAIIGALIKAEIFPNSNIYINDISDERIDIINKKYGVFVIKNNTELFSKCDIVVIAVKPQQLPKMLEDIVQNSDYSVSKRKLIISIAAGITINKIEQILYGPLDNSSKENLPIIRVMPNTPALVLAGMSGMSRNQYTDQRDADTAADILKSMGQVLEFKEEDLDAVTAVSGSGPAYVFYFIEAMIQGGIETGLTKEHSEKLTLGTIQGALKLMLSNNESPEELRRKVTSPGGTTEAAISVFDKNNVKQNIIDGIIAAAHRSKELS